MSFPKPPAYTGVVKLANCWIAYHTKGIAKNFINCFLESDLKVAQLTAQTFANINNIPYISKLATLDRPIITVYKDNSIWYPIEVYAEEVIPLKSWESLTLGSTQKNAINIARVIAQTWQCPFIPSLGMSLGMP
jgi:hypothetical protein